MNRHGLALCVCCALTGASGCVATKPALLLNAYEQVVLGDVLPPELDLPDATKSGRDGDIFHFKQYVTDAGEWIVVRCDGEGRVLAKHYGAEGDAFNLPTLWMMSYHRSQSHVLVDSSFDDMSPTEAVDYLGESCRALRSQGLGNVTATARNSLRELLTILRELDNVTDDDLVVARKSVPRTVPVLERATLCARRVSPRVFHLTAEHRCEVSMVAATVSGWASFATGTH